MHISRAISIFLTLCIAFGIVDFPYDSDIEQQAWEINQLTFDHLEIPLFLPEILPPYNNETNEETIYFFDAVISDEAYQIDIYDISEYNFAGEKYDTMRLPLSCKLGGIYGSNDIQIGTSLDLDNDDGGHKEYMELIPDLYAQIGEEGTSVRWEDTGWKFEFSGSSGRLPELQQFAVRWKEIAPIAPQGIVRIYQKSIYFMWADEDCHYCYEAYHTDLLSALAVFESFQEVVG